MSIFKNMFSSSETPNQQPKIDWKQLTEANQLDELTTLSAQQPVLIFKHSTQCFISKTALKQFEQHWNNNNKITIYFLDLLSHRNLSNLIAERFAVEHQSPQVLLIENGKAVFNASHSAIDAMYFNKMKM